MQKLLPPISTGQKDPDTGTNKKGGTVTETIYTNEDGSGTYVISPSSQGFSGGAFDYL